MLYTALATFAAYLLGSLTFAVFVCKLLGLPDPRTYGSKNPGSSNVLRSGSKIAALLTLLLDALKGFIPVMLVTRYGEPYGMGDIAVALVGLVAFFGHLYPVFFKFKGGKGVATAAGVIFAISWPLGLATLGTWLIIVFFFRYSSLAALVAAVFAPVYYLMGDGVAWNAETPLTAALVVMSAMLVYAHRENITRLLKGTESKLGKKTI
ncbi:MAG: glycerol-3-phosphate 1-O-acyltransferase PlsY [Cytophagales bacterium]|nr:glycerol-3-phosphate 1-O-acyltransferase PlsY [Cytophagales bacterium]